jgi:hypothetical protein
MATALLSGTVVPSATETEIRAGGQTIIFTLTGDTWVAKGLFDPDLFDPAIFDTGAFGAARQAFINGSSGDGTEWDAEKSNIPVSAVVRTSDTVLTLTLSGLSGYDIAVDEVVSWTIPGAAVVSGTPIVASNTFTVESVVGVDFRDLITLDVVDRILATLK